MKTKGNMPKSHAFGQGGNMSIKLSHSSQDHLSWTHTICYISSRNGFILLDDLSQPEQVTPAFLNPIQKPFEDARPDNRVEGPCAGQIQPCPRLAHLVERGERGAGSYEIPVAHSFSPHRHTCLIRIIQASKGERRYNQ